MLTRSAIGVIQLLVLSRLFDPGEFGLLAIVLAIQALGLLVSDLGLSAAIIHFPRPSEIQRATLFWANVMTGALLSGGIAALSPVFAAYFGEPELAGVLAISALAIGLGAPWQHIRASGERDLQFALLARTEIVSAVLAFAVTIILAISGAGVMAPVAGVIVYAISSSALGWIWLTPGWYPRLSFRPFEVRAHIRYGLQCIAIGFSNALGMQADVLVAGRMFNGTQLGYYHPVREIALRVMLVVNPILTRVSFPLIARQHHAGKAVAELYGQTLVLTVSTCFPLYTALGLFAPQIVELLLGVRWVPSVPLFQALALWCAMRAIGNPVGALLLGVGQSQRALVLSAGTTVLVVAAAVIGARWGGLAGVPLALAMLYGALIVPVWKIAVFPATGLGFSTYHGILLRPAMCTILAGLLAATAAGFVPGHAGQLAAGLLAGGVAYLAASAALNRTFVDALLQLTSLSRSRMAA